MYPTMTYFRFSVAGTPVGMLNRPWRPRKIRLVDEFGDAVPVGVVGVAVVVPVVLGLVTDVVSTGGRLTVVN